MPDYTQVITVQQMRDLYLPAGLRGVSSLTDAQITGAIGYGCELFRTSTGVQLLTLKVRPLAEHDGLDSSEYDEVGQRLPWRCRAAFTFPRVALPVMVLQEITRVRGVYMGEPVVEYPLSWIEAHLRAGWFQVVPSHESSSLSLSGLWATWAGRMWTTKYLPGYWAVDHTYGLPAPQITEDIKAWVGTTAAIYLMRHIPLGPVRSKSISVDGVSKSLTRADVIETLQQSLGDPKDLVKQLKLRYRGFVVHST